MKMCIRDSASVYGKLGIMFPMVISVEEVEKIKEMCEEVKRELKSSGRCV